MNGAILAGLALIAAMLVTLIVIQLRTGDGAVNAMLQQQLIEVRARLDSLSSTQQEVPRVIAENTADQLRSLSDVRSQLERVSEATERLETVGRSVAEVQELLSVPHLRGIVGELWLEELLRQVLPSGLYEMQHEFKSGERVDAVLNVGDRLVPIDSKFPLDACQRMLRADGAEADRERRAFSRSLKDRVDEIADKYVKPEEGTYEFALMYIPAENVYYEAVVREDEVGGPSLSSYALQRKVFPVSPNTLYAYVAALVHGLKGLEVERSARQILDALGSLEQQFLHFERAYELVGKHLTNAAKQHGETDRQLRLVRGRFDSIKALGNVED